MGQFPNLHEKNNGPTNVASCPPKTGQCIQRWLHTAVCLVHQTCAGRLETHPHDSLHPSPPRALGPPHAIPMAPVSRPIQKVFTPRSQKEGAGFIIRCRLCRNVRPRPSALYVRATRTGSCVLHVPKAQGSLARGATHCTYAVRVPASGVPYVPRTVWCTAGGRSAAPTPLAATNPNPDPNPNPNPNPNPKP